jgi:uncharacterized protein YndB with AHSA1/START domain
MTTTHAPSGVLTASSDATGIYIVRVLDAPPELVFKCWTEPEHFAAWFGEHGSSMPVDTVTMDVRPGGAWRAVMHVMEPGPMELVFHGEFREIDPPRHLVMTVDDLSGDIPSSVDELFTVDLVDLGGRTEMTFSQTGGNLPSDEYSKAMRGELIFFDRMAEHLAEEVTR